LPKTPLAFCSISALDRPLAAAARLAVEAGLEGLEVTARPPHLDPRATPDDVRAAGRAVRAAGADVTAYGSYLGRADVLGADAHGAEAGEREARVAAALGTPLLRVWADGVRGEADEGFPRVVATLRAACPSASPPRSPRTPAASRPAPATST
jgi:sugar phosphate isomerase/epimerase